MKVGRRTQITTQTNVWKYDKTGQKHRIPNYKTLEKLLRALIW